MLVRPSCFLKKLFFSEEFFSKKRHRFQGLRSFSDVRAPELHSAFFRGSPPSPHCTTVGPSRGLFYLKDAGSPPGDAAGSLLTKAALLLGSRELIKAQD